MVSVLLLRLLLRRHLLLLHHRLAHRHLLLRHHGLLHGLLYHLRLHHLLLLSLEDRLTHGHLLLLLNRLLELGLRLEIVRRRLVGKYLLFGHYFSSLRDSWLLDKDHGRVARIYQCELVSESLRLELIVKSFTRVTLFVGSDDFQSVPN